MDSEVRAHPFSADRPIMSSAEDRLNRRDFAHALADSISSWNGDDSLVIGVYGPWGSGKTSVINLVLERLHDEVLTPDIVLFNPWEWSGHEELATAFFRDLEGALKIERRADAARLAELFNRYARVLNAGAALGNSVAPIATAVFAILVAVGGATILLDQVSSFLTGGVLVVIGAVGLIASHIGRVVEAIGTAFQQPKALDKSLAEVKHDLEAALREYDKTILVVIDDSDRLTPSDAVRLLQLVKANTDLPKMVYTLLFDHDSLAKSVGAALRVDGAGYIEKIVQVPVHVPKADKQALESILFAGLNRVLEPEGIERRFRKDRWSSLYLNGYNSVGINSFFATPRNIARFLSAIEFDLGRHLDRGDCNVDPVDFIGTEVLRVFEMGVYDAVAAEKTFLTGASSGDMRQQEQAKQALARILEKAPVGISRSAVEHILRELFPPAEWALTGAGQMFDRNRLLADRRVSHRDVFDFYFQMTVPSASLSAGEIRQVVGAASAGKESLVDALRNLMERSLIRPFLRDTAASFERIPVGQERVFISALFDVGDQLEGHGERKLEISDTLRSAFIIGDLLRRVPVEERLGVVEQAIVETNGVALPSDFVRLELRRGGRDERPVIEDEKGLRRLGRALAARIANLAVDEGSLLASRHLVELMYAWLEFDTPDAVKLWAGKQAATPEGLLRLFKAFAGYARSEGGHPLEDFIDLQLAIDKAEQWLASDELEPATAEGLSGAIAAAREF